MKRQMDVIDRWKDPGAQGGSTHNIRPDFELQMTLIWVIDHLFVYSVECELWPYQIHEMQTMPVATTAKSTRD